MAATDAPAAGAQWAARCEADIDAALLCRTITSSYFVCACTGRSLDLLLPCASALLCFVSLATAAQLCNRRVKQDKVSPRLARVKPDDRTTQRGECETFRLAIEIAEPPCFEEPSSPPPAESSSSRAIVEDLSLRR